uniref:SAP domain-containing protein n=1 Tax=Aegilops tauschii subsp. strangulata TaxID=200361 RepID=A0A453HR61_AEGTS
RRRTPTLPLSRALVRRRSFRYLLPPPDPLPSPHPNRCRSSFLLSRPPAHRNPGKTAAMASAPGGDPVLAACKDKLKHFRLKELKDVLYKIGLSKHGKKQ